MLTVKRNGRRLSITVPVSTGGTRLEVRLFSDANRYIFEYSDVSPHTPSSPRSQAAEVFDVEWAKREEAKRQSDKDLRFPIVDIVVKPGMEGVMEIDHQLPGEYSFNGNFRPETHAITKEIRIADDRLEHWENAVLLDPKTNAIQRFYISSKVDTVDANTVFEFETLRDDWTGSVSVYDAVQNKLIAETKIALDPCMPKISTGHGVGRQRLLDSLSWTLKYILNCRNTKSDSPTFGGLYLLYDMAARTQLRSDWPWTWGPSATLLLKASQIPGVDAGMGRDELSKAAAEIAEATLKQRIVDPKHPANGLMLTTNEPGSIHSHGFVNKASAGDTLYLAGWGWMPFYKATGDGRFLDATEQAVMASERLMNHTEGGMIPQAYRMKEETWIMNMFYETSMGLKGLAEFSMETGDIRHQEIMIRFVDRLLDTFQREDGLWQAMLYGQVGEVSSCNYFTKSFGYSAEGLLAVHEAAPNRGYLGRAEKIAEHILSAQAPDGSWAVRWDRPAEEVGVTDKGTALWALLFLRFYKTTKDKQYLVAATKALEWCINNQYFGDDTAARGGIVGRSWPSGIIYRHWFDMITTYTMAFFGNALVEALSLDEFSDE